MNSVRSSRRNPLRRDVPRVEAMAVFREEELSALEARHPDGLSVQEVVEVFTRRGARLTEATFRKYVQLGLVSRSTRVGRKGKHMGSQGRYPASAIRQIDHIRRLMQQGITIEDIQREFLFVRGDIDALERQLARVYSALDEAIAARVQDDAARTDARALDEARSVGGDLLSRLETIERRLTLRARMARALV